MLAAVAQTGPLAYPVEIVGFSDEEGVRFRRPYMGSRAMVDGWSDDDLARVDEAGTSVAQAMQAVGLDVNDLPSARIRAASYFAFFEPHIEQGPVLEARQQPVGVVSAICAQRWLELSLKGQACHAGTTPMALRRDALAAAAELILTAERMANEEPELLVTVGRLKAWPNVGNAVPGQVAFSVDMRHCSDSGIERATRRFLDEAATVAHRRGLELQHEQLSQQSAVACDSSLRSALARAIDAVYGQIQRSDALKQSKSAAGPTPPPNVEQTTAGPPPDGTRYELLSGAGHDARILAKLMPVAMLFLRSPAGLSHHPDETVFPDDVAVALDVIVAFLLSLRPSSPQ